MAETSIPDSVEARIEAGMPPLVAWRYYRGLSIRDLAVAVDETPSALIALELGYRRGTRQLSAKVAAVLGAPYDLASEV